MSPNIRCMHYEHYILRAITIRASRGKGIPHPAQLQHHD